MGGDVRSFRGEENTGKSQKAGDLGENGMIVWKHKGEFKEKTIRVSISFSPDLDLEVVNYMEGS